MKDVGGKNMTTTPERAAITAGAQPSAPPLRDEHLRQIGAARKNARAITRCASVAAASGWTTAVFASVSLLIAVVSSDYSPRTIFITLALALVAWHELRGGAAMRRFEPGASRRLWINQIAFGGALIVYAGWGLLGSLTASGPATPSTGDAQMDASIQQLSRLVAFALYGGVALAGVLGPGLMALYYARRGVALRRFLATTPEWIVQTLRAGLG